jgi:hypothetical protein
MGYGKDSNGPFRYMAIDIMRPAQLCEVLYATATGGLQSRGEGCDVPENARLRTEKEWTAAAAAMRDKLYPG